MPRATSSTLRRLCGKHLQFILRPALERGPRGSSPGPRMSLRGLGHGGGWERMCQAARAPAHFPRAPLLQLYLVVI